MIRFPEMSRDVARGRFISVSMFVLVLFGILLARVWYLQIYHGQKFKRFSERNRITIKKIPAMRGRILDRNGVIVADSRPSFDLTLTKARMKEPLGRILDRLGAMLRWSGQDREDVEFKLSEAPPHEGVVIKRDMSRDEVARVLARHYSLGGVEIVHSPARSYPYGTHGSHLLGYLGEINREEFRKLRDAGDGAYSLGDVWGITGVEKKFEPVLRGTHGARPFIEDAWGREIGEELSADLLPAFRARDPLPGKDLVLALDARLQEAAEEAFAHEAGAVVALDPGNGDVLALISRPEYAPEHFVRGVSGRYWKTLMEMPKNPLYDRALRGLYPPASTFKFVTGAALLEFDVASPEQAVFCPGFYTLGRETKRCWQPKGHGSVNFHDGLKHSCDVYFYEMGRRLGIERIADMAKRFGLGRATGIGINREEEGLVPTEAWKRRVYRQPWVGGETLSVAIGQGALQTTPIQLAVALSALANGGTLYRPRIALRAEEAGGGEVELYDKEVRSTLTLRPKARSLVLDGMAAVVNEPGGTAYYSARSQLVEIGGKTGTAQVVGRYAGKKVEDHAWFVAFAPLKDPKIVVVVIVEHGGRGGATAGPIARKVIESYLGGTG